MTSGVYRLTFSSGADYIGKSINIDSRYADHLRAFRDRKAATKMQAEFDKCGEPTLEVVIEAHPEHIDILESYIISHERPALNSRAPLAISDAEFDLLMEHKEVLKFSTAVMIKMISNYQDYKTNLEAELEELKLRYETLHLEYMNKMYETEAGEELKQWKQEAGMARQEILTLKQRLDAEVSKSWWQRLVN